MDSGIQTSALTESLIDFMMEMNGHDDQRSFYFPDDRDETAALVREGAVPYVLFDEMHELSACAIADSVADNQTVEVSGPFGSTEARLKLIHKIKEDFPGYDVLLFLSPKNELCKHFTVLSEEYSMEISVPQKTDAAETTGKQETHKTAVYDAKTDSLALHDRLFPDAYANAARLPEEYDILVHRDDGMVTGYIAYEKEEGYIDFIAVVPEYRGKGIARTLIRAALSNMAGKTVRLTVSSSNSNAIALYEALGFTLSQHMIALKV